MKSAIYKREMVRALINAYNQFTKDPTPKHKWDFIRTASINYLSAKKLVNGIALIGLAEVTLDVLQWVDEHFDLQIHVDTMPHQNLWKSLQTVISVAIIADLFGPHHSFHKKHREIERYALRILRKQVFILKQHKSIFAVAAIRREIWKIRFLARRDTYHNLHYVFEILKPRTNDAERFESV